MKACIGLSHQAAVINKKSPKPKRKDIIGAAVLKNYAPVSEQYGFHFECYDKNIFTPVIRLQVREAKPVDKGHYTVYLPAYSDKRIIKVLREIEDTQWQVFSKYATDSIKEKNIQIVPVNNELFIESMLSCTGILCGAGFETPAEAMFLKKKLLVVPMKGQYEQQCNAAALERLGISVIKSLKLKHLDTIKNWINLSRNLAVEYPDITEEIVTELLHKHCLDTKVKLPINMGERPYSLKKFRKLNLGKILNQISIL